MACSELIANNVACLYMYNDCPRVMAKAYFKIYNDNEN